jgi:hypothetical protein
MTPVEMTPAERLVAGQLHELADIPVTDQHLERVHDQLHDRLRALPSAAPRRTRSLLLAAAAAVALVAAAAAVWATSQRPHNVAPAQKLSRSDTVAIRTASDFVDALSLFNVSQARRLLAPGATFTGAVDTRHWEVVMRFFQKTGGQIIPDPCAVLNRTGAEIVVNCPYEYQLMRSGELRLGPYTGSTFEITTRNGRVTHVNMYHATDANGFSTQMWSPFATWIDTFHHRDGAKMYPDWPRQGHWPATDQAIRLWSERTRQFVRYARHLCSHSHQSIFGAVCAGQH